MTDPRYPIGPFQAGGKLTPEERDTLLQQIEEEPARLREAVAGLDNTHVRRRWALTENAPTVKAYEENDWAQLPDASSAPIAMSLNLLDALRIRWLVLWRLMKEEDFARTWKGPGLRLPARGRPRQAPRHLRRVRRPADPEPAADRREAGPCGGTHHPGGRLGEL